MKYEVEEVGEFLIVHVVGNMTAKEKLGDLIERINSNIDKGKINKFLFNLEKVENIDDDGIDVFINCLSLQSENIVDDDISWLQNLDASKIEKEIVLKANKNSLAGEKEGEEESQEESVNLADAYKEKPNAPLTDCFILVTDDNVYDKLYASGVLELMTVYRTREDFTRDQGAAIAN